MINKIRVTCKYTGDNTDIFMIGNCKFKKNDTHTVFLTERQYQNILNRTDITIIEPVNQDNIDDVITANGTVSIESDLQMQYDSSSGKVQWKHESDETWNDLYTPTVSAP